MLAGGSALRLSRVAASPWLHKHPAVERRAVDPPGCGHMAGNLKLQEAAQALPLRGTAVQLQA